MGELRLGIDDAGRGPVLGPMVLAGCLIDSDIEVDLKKLGVRDSKDLTPRRRAMLAEEIRKKAISYELIVINPEEIDSKNHEGTKLNELEAIAAAKIIDKITKDIEKGKVKVYVDCPSTNIKTWKDFLIMKIKDPSKVQVSCEHKADRNHLSVSAASILAKEKREEEMKKLKEKYGSEMGSGYSSDPMTIKFLEKYSKKYKDEGIFRKTWATWKNHTQGSAQKKL